MKYGWVRNSLDNTCIEKQVLSLKSADCKIIYKGISLNSEKDKISLFDLISRLKTGDTLMCTTLDRLGRSIEDIIFVFKKVKEQGAYIECIDSNLNTSGSIDAIDMLEIFNELRIASNKELSMTAKISKGSLGGRPTSISSTTKAKILEDTKQGLEAKLAAEKHGVSISTVRRLIKKQGM